MVIQRLNFPTILKENEETYFRHLEGLISSVDANASMMVVKTDRGMRIRISPSSPELFPPILSQVKKFHTLVSIFVEFSKSMKAGSNISFTIDF